MLSRLRVLILLLATCGVLAACGGDGNDDTPDNRGEAVEKCKDEAAKISDPDARKAAEAACEGDREGARDAIVEQCLEQARQIPDPNARKQAEDGCRRNQ